MKKEQQKICEDKAAAYEFDYYHGANTPGTNKTLLDVNDHYSNGFVSGYNSRDEEVKRLRDALEYCQMWITPYAQTNGKAKQVVDKIESILNLK